MSWYSWRDEYTELRRKYRSVLNSESDPRSLLLAQTKPNIFSLSQDTIIAHQNVIFWLLPVLGIKVFMTNALNSLTQRLNVVECCNDDDVNVQSRNRHWKVDVKAVSNSQSRNSERKCFIPQPPSHSSSKEVNTSKSRNSCFLFSLLSFHWNTCKAKKIHMARIIDDLKHWFLYF